MQDPKRGLYESLITEELARSLGELDPCLEPKQSALRDAEAPDRLALHLGRILRSAVECLPETDRAKMGVALARDLVRHIHLTVEKAEAMGEQPITPGSVLRTIAARLPDGSPERIKEPLIPLLDTTLLTNAPGEPNVRNQLLTEIHSADRIDVVMAFIRRTGIRPLREALKSHRSAGRPVRVLTTIYTNSTEAEALDWLAELGAEVRVSYDTSGTRLHAKAWLFYRDSGWSTAYIGSSNLTHSGQASGLEWNVRVSGARNPDVIDKVGAVFESYWNGGDFVPYDAERFRSETERNRSAGPAVMLSPVELRPEPFQERLLEQIELSRLQGHHRNLLVSATGTGKTVMAAIDYRRLQEAVPRARLLFVAHREEILTQSLHTFRQGLHDHSFGELWVRGQRPTRFEHVFASIQSLRAAGMSNLAPDHFDVVIVDEFHHAAAPSYQALLEHVQPRELLGLTATPERSDGLPILSWFDNRIAAELRLWDAIDQNRLTPFHYYGIHDSTDLRDVPWRRGRGYDIEGLSNLLTSSKQWARLVLTQLLDHADDPERMRVLGFCVSVAHARFMAEVFQEANVAATAVWGDSPDAERKAALKDLRQRKLQVLFSVDLFNEGVDVPEVDTLLLLRPTDSPTLFLQQLGRGLRKAEGKAVCTVLDFVGLHRAEFRFDRRFRALLGGSRKDLINQIEGHFPFLPAGCHMELDAVASKVVLDNIKAAVPKLWSVKVAELEVIAANQERGDVTLSTYLEESGLDLPDVYSSRRSWSDLRADAGFAVAEAGPHEKPIRRASARLLHLDDTVRLEAYQSMLRNPQPPDAATLSERDRRLLRMLVASIMESVITKDVDLDQGAQLLWRHPQVRADLLELLSELSGRIGHVHTPLPDHPDVPLQVHARYTRIEILAAFGVGNAAKLERWQTGIRWVEESATDLLAFTLDKTSGQFSPTTRYRDYAISRDLIHWESQSVTRADSETGQRYQNHGARGSSVMLFSRLRASDRAFWFLGPARYVEHTGERPMAVTWKLEHSLPGDLFASFAAAVA